MEQNFCEGSNNLNINNWFKKVDQPDDVTYCSYCVEHECIDSKLVACINSQIYDCSSFSCCCPNKDKHTTLERVVCLKCRYKFFDGRIIPQSITSCRGCGKNTSDSDYGLYCDRCSCFLHKCAWCGSEIKNGKQTLKKVGAVIPNIITRLQIYRDESLCECSVDAHEQTIMTLFLDDIHNIMNYDIRQMIIKSSIYTKPNHSHKSSFSFIEPSKKKKFILLVGGIMLSLATGLMLIYDLSGKK